MVVDDTKWLISREIPRLRRYALTLVDNPDSADDLVQDCLERALQKRHLWLRRGSIRGWLYRVMRNVFLNQTSRINRDRRNVPIEDMPELTSRLPGQDDRLMCNDIAAAIGALPADQRDAIVLTALEEFSYDEAADILGIPLGTLRSRLSRGRDRLRETYRGEGGQARLRRVK
jgi:RNA polymerase sigma-70 factor, ECF subfamily